MSQIFKYPLHDPDGPLEMPVDAQVLHVATQNGIPTLWALVSNPKHTALRHFVVVGTGHEFEPMGLRYLGTCHNVANLGLVFHIFEKEQL